MNPHQRELEAAANMFKALSDATRLRILVLLAAKERSVGELAEIGDERIGTVSARLQVLLQARLVSRRKEGKNTFYRLADHHVLNMVENAIQHADEHY